MNNCKNCGNLKNGDLIKTDKHNCCILCGKNLYDSLNYSMRVTAMTKRDIRNKLFGILAMCNGFMEVGHTGGERQNEMIKYLPHQIAEAIMKLQDEINNNDIIN